MSAYRKLMVHNEVACWKGNCLNDVTQLLEVSTKKRNEDKTVASSVDLDMLANYDFEHPTEFEDEEYEVGEFENTIPLDENKQLTLHSLAYMAAIVEQKVIRDIAQRGSKACWMCIDVFKENELLDDDFISFIRTKYQKIITPCKSTFDIIQFVEKSLSKYSSQTVSFHSMITHILNTMHVPSHLYKSSLFDESHDHHNELIKHVIDVYLNIKSRNASKIITRLSQKKLLRHQLLKQIHKEGQ